MCNGFQARARFCPARLKPNNCFRITRKTIINWHKSITMPLAQCKVSSWKPCVGAGVPPVKDWTWTTGVIAIFVRKKTKQFNAITLHWWAKSRDYEGMQKLPNWMIRRWPDVTTALRRQWRTKISRIDGAFVNHVPLTTNTHTICYAIASEILESPQSWPFSCLAR